MFTPSEQAQIIHDLQTEREKANRTIADLTTLITQQQKDHKTELLALRKKLRQIHSLCIAPDWSAKRRWRIAELSSP
jgi:hypothetical protein